MIWIFLALFGLNIHLKSKNILLLTVFPVQLSVLSLDKAACMSPTSYQTQYCIWFCHRRADVIRSDKPDSNLNNRDFTAFRSMLYSQTTIHCKCVWHSDGTVPALITNRCSRALNYTHPHLFSHRHQHSENDGIADESTWKREFWSHGHVAKKYHISSTNIFCQDAFFEKAVYWQAWSIALLPM